MALRIPGKPAGRSGEDGPDLLAYELVQEMAANIARLGKRLEEALRELATFDAAPPSDLPAPEADAWRERLVAAAGQALWYYIVQREVSGLRDADTVMRELRVPREVQLRMGLMPPRHP